MEPASQSAVWLRRAAAVVAALLVAVIAYIVISGGDDDSGKDVVAADAAEIRELTQDTGHPVYWAGPKGAETFEWTALSDGKVYIRYLTDGAEIEDPRPLYLTVATYPVGDGVAAVKKAARSSDSGTLNLEGGGTALVNKDSPNVYLAYRGSEYQIEVFHPNPARARELVTSGRIQPVH